MVKVSLETAFEMVMKNEITYASASVLILKVGQRFKRGNV